MPHEAIEQVMKEIQKGDQVTALIDHLSPKDMADFNAQVEAIAQIEKTNSDGTVIDKVGPATVVHDKNGNLEAIMFPGVEGGLYHRQPEAPKGHDAIDPARKVASAEGSSKADDAVQDCTTRSRGDGKGTVLGVEIAVCKSDPS